MDNLKVDEQSALRVSICDCCKCESTIDLKDWIKRYPTLRMEVKSSLGDVSQQRELLIAFQEYLHKEWHEQIICPAVDDFLTKRSNL